jgi:mono/diheme cytochrome c family protein
MMGRKLQSSWIAAGCMALLMLGCGSARRGVPVQPPLSVEEARIAQGQAVFMRVCNGCHPGGEAGLGPALNNKLLPAFAIRFQVRKGLGVMPGFSEDVISDDELDALTAYLIRLRHHD